MRRSGRDEPVATPLGDYDLVCAWCSRMLLGGRWIFAGPVVRRVVTHGICPDCRAELDTRGGRGTAA